MTLFWNYACALARNITVCDGGNALGLWSPRSAALAMGMGSVDTSYPAFGCGGWMVTFRWLPIAAFLRGCLRG
jgi:hypothetical protein